jgi:hypothetical protein
MSFDFPRFDQPVAIDDDRSWTAVFDSYDQRNDDIYYIITIARAGRPADRLVAQIWPSWAGDDWTTRDFGERLRSQLHAIATQGESNTDYRPAWFT